MTTTNERRRASSSTRDPEQLLELFRKKAAYDLDRERARVARLHRWRGNCVRTIARLRHEIELLEVDRDGWKTAADMLGRDLDDITRARARAALSPSAAAAAEGSKGPA